MVSNASRTLALFFAGLALVAGANACKSAEDDSASSEEAATEADGNASLYRPGNRFSGWGGENDEYLDKVQPLLGKRCVTCHGCTTSPCQLKLTSYEGVNRGANPQNYFGVTVFTKATGPTRMKDGETVEDFRTKGFYSVTDGGVDSVMYKMLAHGKQHNTQGFDLTNAFNLVKGKAEVLDFACLDTTKKLNTRLAKPGTGMPLGLAGLPSGEYDTLLKWIEEGAKGPSPEAQKKLEAPRDASTVERWEAFFNQDTAKGRLSARYIYEHLFYGRLHFDDAPQSKGDFFDLVRSSTRTGAIKEVATERPNDDPKKPIFYRLKKHTQIITAKDHSVFHLTDKVRARWEELFLQSAWEPGPDPRYASLNPFAYFEKIPGTVRYQFMLENAHHLIDAMVKGDVCNGSSATYAIRDRFFTMFLKPSSDPSALDPKLGNAQFMALDPTSSSLFNDAAYESAFEAALRRLRPSGLSESDLWDGNKSDKNAWVTVFRHGDNASAHQGPMGQFPETMWVLDYGNFERLYYDLVVLFRPWGPAKHQISTWTTMSHVRGHGEDLFLMFLPEKYRDPLRKEFTPGWARFTETAMRGVGYPSALTGVDDTHPAQDFVSRARKYLGAKIAGATPLDPDPMLPLAQPVADPRTASEVETALVSLTADRGKISDAFPDITWVVIEGGDQPLEYTVLANRIFWSNSRVVGDALPGLARRPELDSMSVIRGHIGAFPELFLRIPIEKIGQVVQAGRGSKQDRVALRTKFEVARNSADFWKFLDEAHARQLKVAPLDAGIVDTSKYVFPLSVNPVR